MAQYARPTSDHTTGDFSPTGAATNWQATDEESPSETDFCGTTAANATQSFRVNLGTVTDPNSSSGHVVRFRCRKTTGSGGTVVAKLYYGTTLVATSSSQTLTTSWTTFSMTLSGAQADAISSYSTLNLEIVKTSGGFSNNCQCSWLEFEVPDPISYVQPTGFANTSSFGSPTLTSTRYVPLNGHENAQAFGSPSVAYAVEPSGIASEEAFGSPMVEPGAVTVEPAGIASAEAFGTLAIAMPLKVAGALNESEVGTPTVIDVGGDFARMARSIRSNKVMVLELRTENSGISSPDPMVAPAIHSFGSHALVIPRQKVGTLGYESGFVRPLIKGATFRNALVSGSRMRGKIEPDTATVVLLNNGEIDDLPDVPVGTRAALLLGSKRGTAWEPRTVFDGELSQSALSRDGRSVTLTLKSCDALLDRPLNADTWQGFGTCLDLSGAAYGELPYDSAWMDELTFTLEFMFSMGKLSTETGVGTIIARPGGPFVVEYDFDTEKLGFYVYDVDGEACGGEVTFPDSPYLFPVQQGWNRISMTWDGTALRVHFDGSSYPLEWVKSGTFGDLRFASAPLRVGALSGGNACTCRVTDVRLWSGVRTNEELAEYARRPLDDEEADGLLLYLKTNEAEGSKCFDDHREVKPMVLSASTLWAPTFMGDPELAGERKPTSWGWVWHRDAVRIDHAEGLYAAHSRYADCRILKVMEGGNGLARDTSVLVGNTKHESDRNRISAPAADLTWPGFSVFVRGQTITISSGLNAGDWTVKDVDEIDGLWLEVEETLADGTEGTIRQYATKTGTAAWNADENMEGFGIFRLLAAPTKEITCRILGEQDSALGSSVVGLMSAMGRSVVGLTDDHFAETWAEVDTERPWVAGYATGREQETLDLAWSRLAASIGAMYGADGRVFDLWLFEEPTAADMSVPSSNRLDLTETELLALEWLRTQQPIGKAVVHYRPNFRVLSTSDLVGAVLEDTSGTGRRIMQELTNEHQTVERELDPTAVSVDEDELPSYLRDRAAAEAMAAINLSLYGVLREVFGVTVKVQPYLYDWRRCLVAILHSRWSTLQTGKTFRILNRDCGRTRVVMEVWG